MSIKSCPVSLPYFDKLCLKQLIDRLSVAFDNHFAVGKNPNIV
jgi:hypothetical protein